MEVRNALPKISENISSGETQDDDVKAPETIHHIAELERLLQKEEQEFKVACCNSWSSPSNIYYFIACIYEERFSCSMCNMKSMSSDKTRQFTHCINLWIR